VANWSNARLIVIGCHPAVLEFSRKARNNPPSIFTSDMLVGEAQELCSERIERWHPGLSRKKYVFQVRNDDGRDHFREISREFKSLHFILVFDDGGDGKFGSYLIRDGHCRTYSIPQKLVNAVLAKHKAVEILNDEDYFEYFEACWELMDLAQAHWERLLERPGKT
jgi:hypothetical protein